MTRRNRVDPFGDLHSVNARGMFTGNRGCLVNEAREIIRHHRGQLWITCVTSYRDWQHALDDPGTWTPLFFLDDAVALAAGHRPCGLCRRDDYLTYQAAVTAGLGRSKPIPATEQNRMLAKERLRRGGGITRSGDRILWPARSDELPDGTVIVDNEQPLLVLGDTVWVFDFDGWQDPRPRPRAPEVNVLTPPTSVLALRHGFAPKLHPSAEIR